MTRHEYDEEASDAWHMDVVREVPDDGRDCCTSR